MQLHALMQHISYIPIIGDGSIEIEHICYDSRDVVANSLFVCIKGVHVDGHAYIHEALKKGAVAIIIDRLISISLDRIKEEFKDISILLVEDSQKALAHISCAFFDYPATKCTMIGITGTKGKTTTSYMIKSILEECGETVGIIGTNGAFIKSNKINLKHTTPPSYEIQKLLHLMVAKGCTFVVMEVSSIGLKMKRVEGITFDYGIFTNLSEDHIGGDEHKDFKEYMYWKKQLFAHCNTSIFNKDDKNCSNMVDTTNENPIFYSLYEESDFKGEKIEFIQNSNKLGSQFQVSSPKFIAENYIPIHLNLPGEFNIYNSLAAISCCKIIGCSNESIKKGLSHVFVKGRMEVVYSNETFHLMIDYAHNSVSLENLLKTLRAYNPKRIVCIFGCGGNRSRTRRYSMGEISGRFADFSIITEDNSRDEPVNKIISDILVGMKKTSGEYVIIPNRKEAIRFSILNAKHGDFILLVGKGHEDYQEIKGIRRPFSEHTIVKEIIDEEIIGDIL